MLLQLSAVSCSLSLLASCITPFFSRAGGVLSHRNSSTHRFPRFPPRNLCSLVTLAVFSLVFAGMDKAYCLSSYLTIIGRIKNSSCNACCHPTQDTSHLVLHCPAKDCLRRSLATLSLCDLWSRSWTIARLLGLHGAPLCLYSSKYVVHQ